MKKIYMDGPGAELMGLRNPVTNIGALENVYLASSRAQISPRAVGLYRGMGKRVLDVALVLLSLPITMPIVALAALALWIEGGQPFYRQSRLGAGGDVFSILKLRTMTRDAESALAQILADDPELRREWEETQKLKADPRVTPVGRFLRATSMDELPQLFNVFKGEMSLVGPRPMMLDQLSMYGDAGSYFAMKPGITGFWQISARNEKNFAYRKEIDALYFQNFSFARDLAVLLRTFGVVLRRTGY